MAVICRWPAFVVIAALVSACSGDGKTELVAGDVMAVALVEAGDGRTLLRYHPAEGSTSRAEMVLDVSLRQVIDGRRAPAVDTPPMRLVMSITVDDVAADGTISERFVVEEYEVVDDGADPAVVEAMQAELDQLVGMSGRYTMTNRGIVTDATINEMELTNPMLEQTLDQFRSQLSALAVPLPEEEVGEGASWDAALAMRLFGIEFNTVFRFEVLKIEGDEITVDVRYEQTMVRGAAEIPGVPADVRVAVKGGSIHGEGESVMDLGEVFPSRSATTASGTMALTMRSEGETAELVQDLNLDVDLRLLD